MNSALLASLVALRKANADSVTDSDKLFLQNVRLQLQQHFDFDDGQMDRSDDRLVVLNLLNSI